MNNNTNLSEEFKIDLFDDSYFFFDTKMKENFVSKGIIYFENLFQVKHQCWQHGCFLGLCISWHSGCYHLASLRYRNFS